MNIELLSGMLGQTKSLEEYFLALLLASILGLAVWVSYKFSVREFSYDRTFGFTLIFVAVVVTSIIITLGTNIALSLGLIGSLSIIRFRTAVKNSIELSYIFWSISVGLAVGSANYQVAAAVTGFLFVLSRALVWAGVFNSFKGGHVLIAVLETKVDAKILVDAVGKTGVKASIRSLSAGDSDLEVVMDLQGVSSHTDLTDLVAKAKSVSGVRNVALSAPSTLVTL